MSAERKRELEQYVSRIVAPLTASAGRKAIMRADLPAHLNASLGEENDADLAIQRFGDADELRRELQATVPWAERLIFGILLSKELSMKRLVWLVAIVAVLFGMAIVMPALAKLNHEGALPRADVIFMLVGTAITLAGLGGIGFGVFRGLRPAR